MPCDCGDGCGRSARGQEFAWPAAARRSTLDANEKAAPLAQAMKDDTGVADDIEQTSPSRETEWMLAVRDNRDRAAFAQLFDHFAPRLKGFAMRAGANSAEAEDIVQDVMIKVWQRAHQFDPEQAQVSGWIYRIARNQQIDRFRKARRPEPEMLLPEEDTVPDAGQVVALEQETAGLRAALSRLKPDQREMVERAYLGELSHTEIQAETGLPLGTIKSRIRLALDKLRHEMKDMRPT